MTRPKVNKDMQPPFSPSDWLELDDLRQWALQDQQFSTSITPCDRSELKQSLTAPLVNEEEELSRLMQRVSRLTNSIQRKRVELSPQRLLYPELLSRIFVHLAEGELELFEFPLAKLRMPQIFRVCKRWRQIALRTSELFSFFNLECDTIFSYPMFKNPLTFIRQTEKWLSLSQSVSLKITFIAERQPLQSTSGAALVWAKLLQQAPRWKNLDCSFSWSTYVELMRTNHTPFNLLDKLTINVLQLRPHDISALENTPAAAPPLELPSLTTLQVTVDNTSTLSLLHFNMPRLITCSLTINFSNLSFHDSDIDAINAFSSKLTKLEMLGCGFMPWYHESGNIATSCFRQPILQHCEIEASNVDACLLSECKNLISLSLKLRNLPIHLDDGGCTTVLRTVKAFKLDLKSHAAVDASNLFTWLPALATFECLAAGTPSPEDAGCTKYLEALKLGTCCPQLRTIAFTKAILERDKLLELMSCRSMTKVDGGVFLITLNDCLSLPSLKSVDYDQLQAAL